VGVLDLGSTSFHLLVSDASATHGLQRVGKRRSRLRLGACLSGSGYIPDDVCDRAVETARKLRDTCEAWRPDRLIAVATAALREADNGVALSKRIAETIGAPVRVLSGEEEARLTFGAFRYRLQLGDAMTLGADLGGGSLELAVGDERDVAWESTLRLGVARLQSEIVHNDPMTCRERDRIRRRVRDSLSPHLDAIQANGARRCIGSGGTVRALARLLTASSDGGGLWSAEGPAIRIERRQLGDLVEQLAASTRDQRLATPGVKRSRADLLPTGAVILHTLLEACGMDHLLACDWGLREGVILEALGLVSATDSQFARSAHSANR
jgi:exopolyphosphatase/guanosine-5'-triphosphate,3'-diphosphate pyrophosphatase